MDERYRDMYFNKFLDKFIKDMEFLDEETLYKILWAFIKAERLVVREDAFEWSQVRQTLQKRANDFSPKTMTDILVLSTKAKDFE